MLLMTCLVVNCNHWIGYHIVNGLLEDDWLVEGVIDKEEKDTLSMFFGRNSNFSFCENVEKKVYDTVISVGVPLKEIDHVHTNRSVIIHPTVPENMKEDTILIKAPLLFGEWMPMNENGMYRNHLFIPFDSTYFLTEAVYIEDFVSYLVKWLNDDIADNKKSAIIKLEHSAYTRDNRPIEKKLEQVKEHYHQFKKYTE